MKYDLGEEVYVNLKPYEGATAKITGAWLNPDTDTLFYNLKFKDGSTLRNAVEGDFTKLPCVESIKIVKLSNVPGAELYSVVEDNITGTKHGMLVYMCVLLVLDVVYMCVYIILNHFIHN